MASSEVQPLSFFHGKPTKYRDFGVNQGRKKKNNKIKGKKPKQKHKHKKNGCHGGIKKNKHKQHPHDAPCTVTGFVIN